MGATLSESLGQLSWPDQIDWSAVLEIIAIDVLLGGDNAVIIALACRNLPPRERRLGILWGTMGAIVLRVVLITAAVALLNVPVLKIAGGVLLLWIGVKLIAPPAGPGHAEIQANTKVWAAVRTIIVADFVMSLDNVIAIAGAAEDADPSQRLGLVIFGLLASVPIIVFGSQLVLRLFDRFPIIITAGGALLGWIGGSMIVGDTLLAGRLPTWPLLHYAAGAAGALFVVGLARLLLARRNAADLASGSAAGSATTTPPPS